MEFILKSRKLIGHVFFWYTFALLLGTHLPRDAMVDLNEQDKAIHFSAYLGLSLLCFAYQTARLQNCRFDCRKLVLILLLFATFDEATQRFSPGRFSTVSDWIANCAGIGFGTMLWGIMLWRHAAVNAGESNVV